MTNHRAFRRNLPLAIAVVFSVVAIVTAAIWRQQDQNQLGDVATMNCLEIEKLKTEFRAEALENYANLDRTLRVLDIERTPEIEAVAQRQRDRKLARFAPREC